MENEFYGLDGFKEFEEMLSKYAGKTENIMGALEDEAEAMVKDVRALPRPRSSINKTGYTHLLDTVAYRKSKDEIEIGWGKYYGPMVEAGTRKMDAQSHMRPTIQKNIDKYHKIVIEKLFGK